MENDTTNGPAAVEADENYARYAETMGGRMRINWDSRVEMSTNAHHVLFSEFLALSGLFDHLVETAPLVYTSPNRPEKRDVIGTAVLGIVDGARRFRHFDSLRGDGVSAETFGLKKVMHCDSVRRGMLKIDSREGLAWAFMENLRCLAPVLPEDYILDLDPTVKTVYGEQEGAEVGYNPHKKGHKSLCYHTMSIASLRMPVGVIVLPGNETAGTDSLPMLSVFYDTLPSALLPAVTRGDVGFGKEEVIATCESRGMHYLFKVARSPKMKAEWRRVMSDPSEWEDAGEGWQTHEFRCQLQGWSKERRMVMVRRPDPELAHAVQVTEAKPEEGQMMLFQDIAQTGNPNLPDGYEWYVLVTDLELGADEVARTYRQRGDCENIFDEMKNQWGWGGFTSHDKGCTAVVAALIAVVANWWNVFTRLGEDGDHREATTSRPLLQRCVASVSTHARERVVTMYTQGKDKTRTVFKNIACFLGKVATASQLKPEARWMVIVHYAFRKFRFEKHEFPPWIDDQYMLNI